MRLRYGKAVWPLLLSVVLTACGKSAGTGNISGGENAVAAQSAAGEKSTAGAEGTAGTEDLAEGSKDDEKEDTPGEDEKAEEPSGDAGDDTQKEAAAPSWTSMEHTGSLDLSYADAFGVDEYGDYRLITIGEDEQEFLLVPEDKPVPTDVPSGIVILKQPLDHTCLVSSSAMDYIVTIGALGDITLSGTKEDDWYIPEAREAMEKGDIVYAGKYSAPDYELILGSSCNFVLENTMIYHNPEVKEKLESLGIPVMVERSSYEDDPFGRLEWIRLYGILYGKEEKADTWFFDEINSLQSVLHEKKTDLTAAYFSVTSNGSVTIRKPGDYISRMISLAGGTYVFTSAPGEDENALSTMNIQFEEFYQTARDADVLIYNSTIEGELKSVDDLIAKNALFADFKAVKSGNVWTTGNNFFQHPTGMGTFIRDLHAVLTGTEDDTLLTYLKKLR